MKYIINVSDEVIELMGGHISVFVEPEFKTGECKHYALRLSKEDLVPYAHAQLDRKAIEDGAWKFLVFLIDEMEQDEKYECFGMPSAYKIVSNMSYQEAKSKYEAWLKQKDEIRVGDEVGNGFVKGTAFFVDETMVEGFFIDDNEEIEHFWWNKRDCKKTGRHFNEVLELLKKMRGEE